MEWLILIGIGIYIYSKLGDRSDRTNTNVSVTGDTSISYRCLYLELREIKSIIIKYRIMGVLELKLNTKAVLPIISTFY